MNLLQIRELFREVSGRWELVNNDLSDAGADHYINEAIRWLDRRADVNRAWATIPLWVPQGSWVVQFPTARSIRNVRYEHLPVCIIKPVDMFGYLNRFEGRLPTAIPSACSILVTAQAEEGTLPKTTENFKEFFSSIEISNATDEVNTVIFDAHVPNEDAMISLVGMFYQQPLIEDTDTNFWSRNHSMLLVNAAVRQVHVASGNKALLDILNEEMQADFTAFEFDRIEESLEGNSQMRSNF